MEGERVTASPQPSCGGRTVKVNTVKKLQRREISSKRDGASSMSNAQERFRNMHLQGEYDIHDPKGMCSTELPFLNMRSQVIKIVAGRGIAVALTHSGVCAAFCRETNRRICFLNASPDETIQGLFYNINDESFITGAIYASDNFESLKCRATRMEYIKRGQPDAGFPLFESESLKFPGFVKFDHVNGKALIFSAHDSVYKVFDLKNYTLLCYIPDKDVQDIKISRGTMLLIFPKDSDYVPLKILSIEDGTVVKSFNLLLHGNKEVDFIKQYNGKLLVKQENENLRIIDIRSSELTEVNITESVTPSLFTCLFENQLFLTIRNRTVSLWDFRGELITSFEDRLLWVPASTSQTICMTSDESTIC